MKNQTSLNSDVMAEKYTWPEYLKKSKKLTFWEIEDICNQSLNDFRNARNQIKKLVEDLINRLE